jgi:hypothetical protein
MMCCKFVSHYDQILEVTYYNIVYLIDNRKDQQAQYNILQANVVVLTPVVFNYLINFFYYRLHFTLPAEVESFRVASPFI